MNTFDRAVVIVNALMAAYAVWANIAALRGASEQWRHVRASIAAVAAVYVVGYSWLAIFPDSIITWSQTMRGVSMLAWPVVWIVPAVVQRRSNQRLIEILEEANRV